MAYGKKRTKGPISKALAGKIQGGLSGGLEAAANNYKNAVTNAGDAWLAGEVSYLSYYYPKIESVMKQLDNANYSWEERMRREMLATSEIASDYDREKRKKIRDNIVAAVQGGASGISYNSTAGNTLGIVSKKPQQKNGVKIVV